MNKPQTPPSTPGSKSPGPTSPGPTSPMPQHRCGPRQTHPSHVAALLRQGKSKYHAKKSGGYDSRKEHRRANELRLMQRAGLITNLKEQVAYELIPAQRDKSGKLLERACSYVADFVYEDENGNTIVEDTKGMKTDVYIIKRKLMLHVHGIRITEK